MKPSRELIKQEPIAALEKFEPPPPQSYHYGVDPNADNEVHLLDYWRAIRKRLWMVLGVVALITMLAVVYVARKPDFYEAETRVQVNLEDTGGLSNNTRPLYGPADDPIYFNTQLQILSSPGLMRRVVRTLDLEHNPDFFKGNPALRPSTWQTLRKMVGLSSKPPDSGNKQPDQLPLTTTIAQATAREDLNEAKRLEPYVNAILGSLKIEPVKETRAAYYRETRLIDIKYSHTDPQVTAKVVNAIAETYAFSNLEKRTETNNTTGTFLQKRIAELQQQIRTSEERLVNYARNNQIISLDPNQNTVVERLAGLNQQLLEAESERKSAEAAFNAANAPGAAGALVDADAKQANETEGKLIDLRQKRALLLVEATEEAPEVKEIDQQIGELERQRTDLRGRKSATLLTNLNTHYQQALQREQSLRKAFEQQRAQTLSQNEAAINYRIIQQEIETNKQLLNGLLQGAKENDVVLAGKPNNISIVDYALTPDSPVGPNRARTVLAAFFLSIGAGLGLALLLEYLDDTVHSTEEVERVLHLPALAVIPSVGAAVRRRAIPGMTALQKQNGSNGDNAELLINVDGRSPLAEA
ncbi:MAG TPA: Wzz/FepE/Etk N-terminal domain-containing protein, partial [Pyrinomonadaceae bacterium]